MLVIAPMEMRENLVSLNKIQRKFAAHFRCIPLRFVAFYRLRFIEKQYLLGDFFWHAYLFWYILCCEFLIIMHSNFFLAYQYSLDLRNIHIYHYCCFFLILGSILQNDKRCCPKTWLSKTLFNSFHFLSCPARS